MRQASKHIHLAVRSEYDTIHNGITQLIEWYSVYCHTFFQQSANYLHSAASLSIQLNLTHPIRREIYSIRR